MGFWSWRGGAEEALPGEDGAAEAAGSELFQKNRSRTLCIFAGGVYFRVRLPVFHFLSLGMSLSVLRFNFRFPEVFRT